MKENLSLPNTPITKLAPTATLCQKDPMNTPAHAIINLVLFKRKCRESYPLAIIFGALVPDLPMFIFYTWKKFTGAAEQHIWGEAYFQAHWQHIFDVFHSFPLLAAATFITWRLRLQAATVFFASMFIHSCFDFPVHHNDAHHHFYPLSDWQFHSPISYWNPDYYGQYVSIAELVFVIVASLWFLKTSNNNKIKWSVSAILLIYLSFLGFMTLYWFKAS